MNGVRIADFGLFFCGFFGRRQRSRVSLAHAFATLCDVRQGIPRLVLRTITIAGFVEMTSARVGRLVQVISRKIVNCIRTKYVPCILIKGNAQI